MASWRWLPNVEHLLQMSWECEKQPALRSGQTEMVFILARTLEYYLPCWREAALRFIDHAWNSRFLGLYGNAGQLSWSRVIRLRAFWLRGYSLLMRSVSGLWAQIILPHALPLQLPVVYSLGLSASSLLLSTSASRDFPHPGAVAGQTEAPRPVLTLQGSWVFNRILLKMLPWVTQSDTVGFLTVSPKSTAGMAALGLSCEAQLLEMASVSSQPTWPAWLSPIHMASALLGYPFASFVDSQNSLFLS